MLRAYVAEAPDTVIRAIDVRPGLLGYAGPEVSRPLGVLSGAIFAAVTRASFTVCVTWFQYLVWTRV